LLFLIRLFFFPYNEKRNSCGFLILTLMSWKNAESRQRTGKDVDLRRADGHSSFPVSRCKTVKRSLQLIQLKGSGYCVWRCHIGEYVTVSFLCMSRFSDPYISYNFFELALISGPIKRQIINPVPTPLIEVPFLLLIAWRRHRKKVLK
jgi:hypothetical protein